MRLALFVVSLVLIISGDKALALRNITVDDTNTTAIDYFPRESWGFSSLHQSPLDYGGGHSLSDNGDSTARATFSFNGVAIYYMSPLWPYPVDTAISVDSGPKEVIDMTDNLPSYGTGGENVQSTAIWGRIGLENGMHEVVVSLHKEFVVVDAFIYTVLEEDDDSSLSISGLSSVLSSTSPSSSSPSSSTSTTQSMSSVAASSSTSTTIHSPSQSSNRDRIAAITIGCAAGVLTVVVIVMLCLRCCRRRQDVEQNLIQPFGRIPENYCPNMWSENTTPFPWADRYSMPLAPSAASRFSHIPHMAETVRGVDPVASRKLLQPLPGIKTLITGNFGRNRHGPSVLSMPTSSFASLPETGHSTESLAGLSSTSTTRATLLYHSALGRARSLEKFAFGKGSQRPRHHSQNLNASGFSRSPPPYQKSG